MQCNNNINGKKKETIKNNLLPSSESKLERKIVDLPLNDTWDTWPPHVHLVHISFFSFFPFLSLHNSIFGFLCPFLQCLSNNMANLLTEIFSLLSVFGTFGMCYGFCLLPLKKNYTNGNAALSHQEKMGIYRVK